jgi:hypothetical protein
MVEINERLPVGKTRFVQSDAATARDSPLAVRQLGAMPGQQTEGVAQIAEETGLAQQTSIELRMTLVVGRRLWLVGTHPRVWRLSVPTSPSSSRL